MDQGQLSRLQARMQEEEAGLLVISPGANLKYLTGVDCESSRRHLLFFLPDEGSPIALVPEVERTVGFECETRFWGQGDDPVAEIQEIVEDLEASGTFALEDTMMEMHSLDVRSSTDTDTVLASEVISPLRQVKQGREKKHLGRASRIADKTMEELMNKDAVGKTERELASWIEETLLEKGASETSFQTIVAAGENGAKPHHDPTGREIARGEPVVVDFGCVHKGYCSDQTRTLLWGNPPEKVRKVHQVVKRAQQNALEAVESGAACSEVDAAARNLIEQEGYGECFPHSTGHGVGVEVHEAPSISSRSDETLSENSIVTIEPGVYIEGEFGVRIEDMVLVKSDGAERLYKTSRELKVR